MTQSANKKLLPLAEWFAENAYIAPGMHRLMTAAGLMGGLYLGREMMNVLTGTNANDEPVLKERLAPPLQRFHGMLAYNKYDDTPEAQWHKVADAFVPLFFGALGAMAGSSEFAKSTPMMKGMVEDLSKGSHHFQLQHADMLANKTQAKLLNFLSGFGLNMGSSSGVHLFPSMLASSTSAFRFQLDHGKNIIMPGLRWISGNRGHSSRNMFTSLSDFVSWAQNNAAHYTNQGWYHAETQPILKYAKDMLQVFKQATPAQRKIVEQRIEHLCQELDAIAAEEAKKVGGQGDRLYRELTRPDSPFDKKMQEFLSGGLEQSFIKAGLIDPHNLEKTMENITLGDYGLISRAVKTLGGRKEISEYKDQFNRSVKQRHSGDETARRVKRLMPVDLPPYITGAAAVGGTVGATYYLGGHADSEEDKQPKPTEDLVDRTKPRSQQAKQYHNALELRRDKDGIRGAINGKPLDTLGWMSSVLVVPPGLHRFMNAAALSLFLYGGGKTAEALAGRSMRGKRLNEDDIWPALRPLFDKMNYVWRSSETSDRWKHVAHQLMPVSVGMLGTYAGSRLYFQDAIERAHKAEYLEEYTDRVSLEESETYARASAFTSILNTGAGLHMLPFVSYPSNLQNRFLMARGQQVASPGVGKWWSGNPSKYPWHVRGLLDKMTTYAVENTGEFPKELDAMSHAVLAKLYPDITGEALTEKCDQLVDKIYEVRDRYWQPGGIPEAQKPDARDALESVLRREGLEHTLQELGLNPLEANLDHNGMSGRVAKLFGASGRVSQTINEYRIKAAERLASNDNLPPASNDNPSTSDQNAPDTQIKTPAPEPVVLAEAVQSQQVH